MAMTELGNISERRIMRLTDEASNAHVLPAFLTKHGGLNSGFMITQYTAAALATQNKVLAHPASVDAQLRHAQVVAAEVMVIPRSCSWAIQSMTALPSWTSPIL